MTRRPLRDWPAILRAAEQSGACYSDVARAEGVPYQTVRSACRRHAIRLSRGKHGGARFKIDWHKELLAAALAEESANDFCISRGVSIGALENAEKRHGVMLPRRQGRAA